MINRKLQLQFLVFLLGLILLLSFFILKPFLAPLALAAVFAVVLQPLFKRILKYVPNRNGFAPLSTVFISVVCIVIPLWFIGIHIFKEAAQLYASLVAGQDRQDIAITLIKSLGQLSENFIPGTAGFFNNLSANLDVYIKEGLTWLTQHLGGALSTLSGLLLDLFIFLVSLYYLLQDGPKLKKALIALSPLEDRDDKIIFDRLESAVNSVVKGSLLIAFIQGILTALGFIFFSVPNGVLWGTVTVIAALIPGIGTALVVIPGVIYLFIVGNTISAIGLLLWGVIVVGTIDNLLRPTVVGRDLQLHPLFILLSVLGGLVFFGPIGLFLGPIIMSLLFAFISIYSYLVTDVGLEKIS
jgi:predicted PurR-regulated permease PerM